MFLGGNLPTFPLPPSFGRPKLPSEEFSGIERYFHPFIRLRSVISRAARRTLMKTPRIIASAAFPHEKNPGSSRVALWIIDPATDRNSSLFGFEPELSSKQARNWAFVDNGGCSTVNWVWIARFYWVDWVWNSHTRLWRSERLKTWHVRLKRRRQHVRLISLMQKGRLIPLPHPKSTLRLLLYKLLVSIFKIPSFRKKYK